MSVSDSVRSDTGKQDGFNCKLETPSLAESFRSIRVPGSGGILRRFLAFIGPGFLVSVGYMDPGNWAMSIAGGSEFGYTLLSAVLLSSLMAILLQSLCVRFSIATGRDLAQACRDSYSRPVALVLWVLAELAIIATDLAEVIGTAIGLQLLFGLPLVWGVGVAALDVFLILYLQNKGFRWIEAFVVAMILVIAICFAGQIFLAQPAVSGVVAGFWPSLEIVQDQRLLFLALGILGATVMPHNLYLHTGIVQTRAYGRNEAGKRDAIRLASLDSTINADGLVGITSRGRQRFRIVSRSVQANQLTVAEVELLANEASQPLPEKYQAAADILRGLLDQLDQPFINMEKRYEDASWVGSRLAELLPIRLEQKQYFLQLDDPIQRLERLIVLLEDLEMR